MRYEMQKKAEQRRAAERLLARRTKLRISCAFDLLQQRAIEAKGTAVCDTVP